MNQHDAQPFWDQQLTGIGDFSNLVAVEPLAHL